MYYNKEKVNQQLEEGVEDAAGTVEELYGYINSLIAAIKDAQADVELQDFIDAWEG